VKLLPLSGLQLSGKNICLNAYRGIRIARGLRRFRNYHQQCGDFSSRILSLPFI
jgi:hypothetical protein